MALEDAMLAVDPHSMRLISVDALEMASTVVQMSRPAATGTDDTSTR